MASKNSNSNTATATHSAGAAAFDAAAAAARGPAPVDNTPAIIPEDPTAQQAVTRVTLEQLAAQSDGWETGAKIVQLKVPGDQITGELLPDRGSIRLNPEVDRRTGEVIEKEPIKTVLLRAGQFVAEIMGAHEIERQIAPLYARLARGERLVVRITRGMDRTVGSRRVSDYVVQSRPVGA